MGLPKAAVKQGKVGYEQCLYGWVQDAWQMPSEEDGASDEMASAETSLKEYETKGRMQGQSLWQRLFEVQPTIVPTLPSPSTTYAVLN